MSLTGIYIFRVRSKAREEFFLRKKAQVRIILSYSVENLKSLHCNHMKTVKFQ